MGEQVKRLLQLVAALVVLCFLRQEIAGLVIFSVLWVCWLLLLVIAYGVGAIAEKVPSLLRQIFFIGEQS